MDFVKTQLGEVNQGGNWKATSRKASESPYNRYVSHFTVYLTSSNIFQRSSFPRLFCLEKGYVHYAFKIYCGIPVVPGALIILFLLLSLLSLLLLH